MGYSHHAPHAAKSHAIQALHIRNNLRVSRSLAKNVSFPHRGHFFFSISLSLITRHIFLSQPPMKRAFYNLTIPKNAQKINFITKAPNYEAFVHKYYAFLAPSWSAATNITDTARPIITHASEVELIYESSFIPTIAAIIRATQGRYFIIYQVLKLIK